MTRTYFILSRRSFLLSSSAFVLLLPGCKSETELVSYSAPDLALITAVASVIIPQTDTPAAGDVGVASFVQEMSAGWATDETRSTLRSAMTWIDTQARENHAVPFTELGVAEQTEIIARLDALAFQDRASLLPPQVSEGYVALKSLVFRGYYLSEVGATDELKYEAVPGDFRGCVSLEIVGRTWAV